LIVDQSSLMMISLVYSQTQLLQREVFFITTLDKMPQEKLAHMKAIIFCRPTEHNVALIQA